MAQDSPQPETTTRPTDDYHPWLHRVAVLTACTALLPIVVGALVTTKDAGMAFRDWPSSDGHNMFLYPWLQSAGDKFIEHGHRLAGALIGLLSIALAGLAWRVEPRRSVRRLAILALAAVVLQGLLGGQRVLQDERVLAMIHGNFAALVFCLMAALAQCTGRGWLTVEEQNPRTELTRLKPWAVLVPIAVFAQLILGGLVRHLGTALHEHLAFAFVTFIFAIASVVTAHRSGMTWIRRPAWLLFALLLVQLGLGAGAWVTRFGFPSWGYVAMHQSPPQVVLRTVHAITGLLVMMVSVVYALRVFRLSGSSATARTAGTGALPGTPVSVKGGLA